MMGSLQTGVSGLQQFQQQMDVIGNNIANVNTSGFKTARMDFAEALSQSYQSSGSAGSMQIGTGVATGAIQSQYTQGSISSTGIATDLAVSGQGFFVVRNSVSGDTFATRAGEFRIDKDGYLTDNQGLRVQGFTDGGLGTRGDIQINGAGAPALLPPATVDNRNVTAVSIDSNGKITVRMSDGQEFLRGQVLMQTFKDPQALVKEGNNLLSGFSAAGPLGQLEAANTNGLGEIHSGALEMSNVDLAGEMARLITTQRAFQANARIITTSDELLQELVNLKR
jgi:flagellar hook protein FlgE